MPLKCTYKQLICTAMTVILSIDSQNSSSKGGLKNHICFCWCMLLVYDMKGQRVGWMWIQMTEFSLTKL